MPPPRHGGTRSTARAHAQHGSRCDMRQFINGQHPADSDLVAIRNSSRDDPQLPGSPTSTRVRADALPAIRRVVAATRRTIAPGAAAAAANGMADAYANQPVRERVPPPRRSAKSKSGAREADEVEAFVQSLAQHRFARVEEGEQCAICIEEWEPSDLAVMMPCSHPFHKECISAWLLKSSLCPICKWDSRTQK